MNDKSIMILSDKIFVNHNYKAKGKELLRKYYKLGKMKMDRN